MNSPGNGIPDLNREHLLKHLVGIEAFGESSGWNHSPVLLAITNEPVPGTADEWRLAAGSVDVPRRVWHDADPIEVLDALLAQYRSPASQAVAVLISYNNPHTRIVGWAFVYIMQSADGKEARVVDAADEHGGLYRIARLRGAAPENEYDADGSVYAETPTHRILLQLVTATRL
ncbi:hypothetical protein ACGFIE_00445 [Micromonospora sp. NPDC049275]|uniref:hypothetical protein n=1 Tax=Micromonospora sp. NPDC049275 TaxID=3364268 RepID=UPI003721E250